MHAYNVMDRLDTVRNVSEYIGITTVIKQENSSKHIKIPPPLKVTKP